MERGYLSTGLALVFGLVVATVATGIERTRGVEPGLAPEPSQDAGRVADPCEVDGSKKVLIVALVVTGDVLDVLDAWAPPAGGAVREDPAPSASRMPVERCPPART